MLLVKKSDHIRPRYPKLTLIMMKCGDYYLVLPNATRNFHINNKVDGELCSGEQRTV